MKVGLKPKKFFHDIILVPHSEIERMEFEIEKHKERNRPQRKPLVLDTVLPEDSIKKGISKLWQKEEMKKEEPGISVQSDTHSLEEVAERILEKKTEIAAIPPTKIRPKTLIKNYLILFIELTFIALMIYNAISLYFDKNWLVEKLNNLALASKVHIALASESLTNFDRTRSSDELTKAGINLLQIKSELLNQGEYSYILPDHPLLNNELTLGQNMLELGLLIRDTNNDLNAVLDSVTDNQSSGGDLAKKIDILKPIITRIKGRVSRADIILKENPDIKKALGADNSSKITDIIDKSKVELDKINEVMDVFPLILGKNGDNRYLVFFLNNAEMRAGGGFPGNYGLVSFSDNKLDKMKIDNIYNLDRPKLEEEDKINTAAYNGSDAIKQLGMESFAYPEPVERNAKGDPARYWQMSYSNWNIDFGDNARREEYLYSNFYQQGQVSGAIAVTPDLIENILAVIGPIKMEDYGVEINKDNFRDVIENKVEVDNLYKKEQRYDINPKQILVDFGPKFLDKISAAEIGQKIKILEIFSDSIKSKEVMLYHNDPKVESVISEFGASGEIKNIDGDSLGIFQTNRNAMKNGRVIDNRASLKSNVSSLGFALDELSLTIVNNESNPRFLHGREESYYEIMVPSGSRIREAKMEGKDFIGEIDYFEEAGHTVLGFGIGLDPGEAKNIMIKYQAPISGYTDHGYSLDVFKQAGAKPIEFSGEINFEKNGQNLNNPLIFKRAIDSDFIIKN